MPSTDASPTIAGVVAQRLCTGCGTCVAACPQGSIHMEELPAGFPRPVIDAQSCTTCGLCYRACSGIAYHFDLPTDLEALFKPPPRRVVLAWARDARIRAAGQSGGVSTALLAWMLQTGQISHALVTRMRNDGSLRPEAYYARSVEDLLEAVGSKYCQNPVNATLPDWPENAERVAMVGLPCHVHGIRNLADVAPAKWKDRFALIIGMFCLQAGGYLGIEYLVRHAMRRAKPKRMYFRRKTQVGERGCPSIEYDDGTCEDFPEDFLWRFFNPHFVPLRCRFCFDQLNHQSDMAMGDPNGYPDELVRQGMNVVAVYTERGEHVLKQAQSAGAIEFRESDVETMWRGQRVGASRRQRVLESYAFWKQLRRPVPGVPAIENAPSVRTQFSARQNMKFLYDLESVASRKSAYRRVVRTAALWRVYSRLRQLLLRK